MSTMSPANWMPGRANGGMPYLLLMVGRAAQERRAPAMARLHGGLAPAPHARRMAR
jgi:hypothetical protein